MNPIDINKALDRIDAIDNDQMDRAFKLGILYASKFAQKINVMDIQMFGVKLSDNVENMLMDYKDNYGQWGNKK